MRAWKRLFVDADGTGAELLKGEPRDHPPRREALQHPDGSPRQHQAVRFRHLRPTGRLDCQDEGRRMPAVHGGTPSIFRPAKLICSFFSPRVSPRSPSESIRSPRRAATTSGATSGRSASRSSKFQPASSRILSGTRCSTSSLRSDISREASDGCHFSFFILLQVVHGDAPKLISNYTKSTVSTSKKGNLIQECPYSEEFVNLVNTWYIESSRSAVYVV